MSKGFLIAVEGADKAGKHTQSVMMTEYLRGRGVECELFGYPQYDDWFGKMARDYLNGKFGATREIPAEYTMLPYALDRWSSSGKINEWLDAGRVVILDRYVYSNAFSVAKTPRDEWARRLDWLEDLEFNQLKLRRPDLNLYLSLPARVSFEMRNQGLKAYQEGRADIHESDLQLLTDVADVYKLCASRDPEKWRIIDEIKPDGTRMTVDEIFSEIRLVLDKVLTI